MVTVQYEELSAGFYFVSSDAQREHEAYIDRETGRQRNLQIIEVFAPKIVDVDPGREGRFPPDAGDVLVWRRRQLLLGDSGDVEARTLAPAVPSFSSSLFFTPRRGC